MFEHFYVTDLGRLGYLFIYTPLSLLITWLIYRWIFRRLLGRRIGVVTSIGLLCFVLGVPVWDVYQIGQETKRLCEEKAGLHVYKTVESDGFRGDPAIDIWGKRGYLFTENESRDGKKYRYTIQEGVIVKEEVKKFSVHHGVIDYGMREIIDEHHALVATSVGDIVAHDVYAELVRVKTYPGWIDSFFIGITGTRSGFSAWSCGDEAPDGRGMKITVTDLILKAIKPSNRNRGQ